MRTSSPYLGTVFSPGRLKRKVSAVSRHLLKLQKKLKFQAIVFTGVSGASIAFPVSYETGIPVVLIRKKKEGSHGDLIEGPNRLELKRYLILDDFIVTGATVHRVLKTVDSDELFDEDRAQCVGIFLWKSNTCTCDYIMHKNKKIPLFSTTYRG